jgi:hypothetical protein
MLITVIVVVFDSASNLVTGDASPRDALQRSATVVWLGHMGNYDVRAVISALFTILRAHNEASRSTADPSVPIHRVCLGGDAARPACYIARLLECAAK